MKQSNIPLKVACIVHLAFIFLFAVQNHLFVNAAESTDAFWQSTIIVGTLLFLLISFIVDIRINKQTSVYDEGESGDSTLTKRTWNPLLIFAVVLAAIFVGVVLITFEVGAVYTLMSSFTPASFGRLWTTMSGLIIMCFILILVYVFVPKQKNTEKTFVGI